MLFNSTYAENLKKQTIKIRIGCINLGEDHTNLTYFDLMLRAEGIIKKARLDSKTICFEHCREEVDEFGHTEVRLYVCHKREETEKEYKTRIEKLQVSDLQEFYKMLASYNSAVRQRKEIKKLFDKLGKTKSTPPYWMKEMLEKFFNTDADEMQSEINGIYNDAVKYPQLALPEHQLKRLRQLVK